MPIFIALPQGGWYPTNNPGKYCGSIVAPTPLREMIAIDIFAEPTSALPGFLSTLPIVSPFSPPQARPDPPGFS